MDAVTAKTSLGIEEYVVCCGGRREEAIILFLTDGVMTAEETNMVVWRLVWQ